MPSLLKRARLSFDVLFQIAQNLFKLGVVFPELNPCARLGISNYQRMINLWISAQSWLMSY